MVDMGRFSEAADEILKGISDAMSQVDPSQLEGFIETLVNAREEERTILVVGAGRSGLVGRAFAMRLMHLGYSTYVMGETINPSMTEGDLALVISGSGSTTLPVTVAEMAKSIGVKVLVVTSNPDSPLGSMADLRWLCPGEARSHVKMSITQDSCWVSTSPSHPWELSLRTLVWSSWTA